MPSRDPNRIDDVLAQLAGAWRRTPDLRLGQLVNALAEYKDPFYLEDNELALAAQKWKEHGPAY